MDPQPFRSNLTPAPCALSVQLQMAGGACLTPETMEAGLRGQPAAAAPRPPGSDNKVTNSSERRVVLIVRSSSLLVHSTF